MGKTTIELPERLRDRLREERHPHESNYGETIERLLGDSPTDLTTESDVRGIVADMVVAEALE